MSIEMIREMVRTGKSYIEIREVCDQMAGEWWVGVFTGTPKGQTEGFPYRVGRYHTVRYGQQQTFVPSVARVGDSVFGSSCNEWHVVATNAAQGDAHVPGKFWFVAKKKEVTE